MILKIFVYHNNQCCNSIFQNSQKSILCSQLKQCLTNAVFLFKSSSFNLAKLIGFKSRLCSDKRVLKHLPV